MKYDKLYETEKYFKITTKVLAYLITTPSSLLPNNEEKYEKTDTR